MATNFATASYTEVIDLQTVADKVSIIGIHTPRGISPYNRLKGFFQQFRKFRYNGIRSLVMVPAAQLPVDPLGLTGLVGTTDLMDPRDQLNPILFHGCHGEHLTKVLDQIYCKVSSLPAGQTGSTKPVVDSTFDGVVNSSPSADMIDNPMNDSLVFDINNYYAKLTDSSWRKFGIQSGVKLKNMAPLVYRLSRNTPLLPSIGGPSSGYDVFTGDIEQADSSNPSSLTGRNSNVIGGTGVTSPVGSGSGGATVPTAASRTTSGFDNQEFTNGMMRLSWLPTTTASGANAPRVTILPKLFMGVMVLPPAYNIEQFFRMVITHSFSFKDFTSSLGSMDPNDAAADLSLNAAGTPYENWIDYGSTTDSINATSKVVSDGVA